MIIFFTQSCDKKVDPPTSVQNNKYKTIYGTFKGHSIRRDLVENTISIDSNVTFVFGPSDTIETDNTKPLFGKKVNLTNDRYIYLGPCSGTVGYGYYDSTRAEYNFFLYSVCTMMYTGTYDTSSGKLAISGHAGWNVPGTFISRNIQFDLIKQ